MVAGIQTFGQLVHWHCHIHVIVTDGGFTPDGTFVCLPSIDTDRLLTVWEDAAKRSVLAKMAEMFGGRVSLCALPHPRQVKCRSAEKRIQMLYGKSQIKRFYLDR